MNSASPETIRNALGYIPAADRDLWVRMAMAAKSELGEGGFEIFDSWSQTADNYNERDAKDVWRSVKAGGKVSIGTLFYEAKERGYKLNGEASRINPVEIEQHKRERAEALAKEAEAIARRHELAAQQAVEIWRVCQEAREHPYLSKKGIQPHGAKIYKGGLIVGGMRCDGALVIPMRNAAGDIRSLQFIQEGEKRYLANGEKSGCYFSIGKPEGTVCIAEGFATASSIHESTGRAVAVAFDSGNLLSVAQVIKEKLSDAELILCADNDQFTAGNPGLTKARQAADSIGAKLAVPEFQHLESKPTDFNDLARLEGVDAVKRAIETASNGSNGSTPSAHFQGWEVPKPVQAALHPVPAFNAEVMLPEVLRDWVMDEADRMPCPPDFIAAAAIVALGSIVGARCAIKPKSRDDWLVVPNLWGGIVGLPSAKKSPAIGSALKPLDRLIADAMSAHKALIEDFEC